MASAFNARNYELSATQLDSILIHRIVPLLFGGSSPSPEPALILIGAQPGAGKTRAGDAAATESGQEIVRIVGDDLRVFHPQYRELLQLHPAAMPDATAQASSAWIERAIAFAAKNRHSVLVEGTFRNPRVPLSTAQRFADSGFRVETHLVAVAPEVSHVGIGKRFVDDERANGAARFTSLAAHAQSFEALPATIRALSATDSPVGRFVVRSRDAVLFDGTRTAGRRIRGALTVAAGEWNRPRSDAEFDTWKSQATEASRYLIDRHSDDADVVMLVRQLEYDRRYLTMVRSGEVAVRGHVRAGGDVEPHSRSYPRR